MRPRVKYLQQDRGPGRLLYRRAYPVALRPFIPDAPRELTRTLAATSIGDPGALDRYNLAAADYDRVVSLARKASTKTYDILDARRIAWLAETWRSQLLQIDEDRWHAGEAEDTNRLEAAELGYESVREEYSSAKLTRFFYHDAIELLSSQGLHVDDADASFARLAAAMLTVKQEVVLTQQDRRKGAPLPTPDLPPEPLANIITVPTGPRSRASRPEKATGSFATIADGLVDNPMLALSGTTKQASRTALRFWREAHGDIAPADMTRMVVTEFVELLSKRPSSGITKADRNLPLRKVVEKYASRPTLPRLASKSLQQHVGMLSSLWNKAADRGELGERELTNPFGKRRIASTRQHDDGNPELSLAEIKGLFALPIFTAHERPTRGKGEASYWLPLILLWTGARPEEIAQLNIADIIHDPETDRWLLSITGAGEHEQKGKRRLKTDRKGTGRRTFPLPLPLIALGLLDYVTWLEKAGETSLFPKLRVKGERGNLFDSYSAWFVPYLKTAGIIPKGNRRPLRELRHGWTTEARRVDMPQDAREYLQGHRVSANSANDGYGDRSPLGRKIDLIQYAKLDLSRVAEWKPPVAVSTPNPRRAIHR